MEVFVSSLAFLGMTPEQMVEQASSHHWPLEFSSGMPYRKDMADLYLEAKITRMPHNYFPAPEVPFVLNLASRDENIRRTSIEHCKYGLELASKTKAAFFSAHAGFCIDPNPHELGQKIQYDTDFDSKFHREAFLLSLREILQTADKLQLDFLIENNVIAPFNVVKNLNPLLCCESKEITWVFDTIRHPRFGLLLDTAHLKVSCNTLRLSLQDETRAILPFVRGVHHSDNNGEVDDNSSIDENYWFLPYMKEVTNIVHVLEVKKITAEKIQHQINLLQTSGR
jgi:sugar phosphate isomerase/epimerase